MYRTTDFELYETKPITESAFKEFRAVGSFKDRFGTEIHPSKWVLCDIRDYSVGCENFLSDYVTEAGKIEPQGIPENEKIETLTKRAEFFERQAASRKKQLRDTIRSIIAWAFLSSLSRIRYVLDS
jgi:ribosomal protein S18